MRTGISKHYVDEERAEQMGVGQNASGIGMVDAARRKSDIVCTVLATWAGVCVVYAAEYEREFSRCIHNGECCWF